MAKRATKKPCEKDPQSCGNYFGGNCLAFAVPRWNREMEKPFLGFKRVSEVSVYECLEEEHTDPRSGVVFRGVYSPTDLGSRYNQRVWAAKKAVKETSSI